MTLILDPTWLLPSVLLLIYATSRWQYWRGRCEAAEDGATVLASSLRKRIKANSRLLTSYEQRLDTELSWLRDVVDDVVDAALPDTPDTAPDAAAEQPTDGG